MLILVRHGKTALNVGDEDAELIRGNLDVPLDDEGRKEIQNLADSLCGKYPILEVRSSAYARDAETRDIIARTCQARPVTEAKLEPYDVGELSGQLYETFWPILRLLIENPLIPAPGGETYQQWFDEWSAYFWKAYAEFGKRSDVAIVLVIHGNEFRALPTITHGAPLRTDKREHVKTGEIWVIN